MRRRRQVDRDRRLCCYDIAGIEHDRERIWPDRVANALIDVSTVLMISPSLSSSAIRAVVCALIRWTVSEWRVFDWLFVVGCYGRAVQL